MEISLTPQLEHFINQQVETGRFSTPGDVVLAAIQNYEELERIYQGRYETLKAEIQTGLKASERGDVLSEDEVFGSIREKLQQKRTQAG